MSHQSEGKPKSRLIETRELKKVRPIFEGSGEVVRRYDQFKKIFEKTGEYRLFAEPVIAEGQRNFISWYTDLEGDIRSYNHLDEEEKEKIKGQLKHQVDRMRRMAGELSKNETFNRALDNSLEVPALENSVFFVGDRVVLVEWGLIRDEFKPPRGIIKNLIAVEPPEIKTAAMQIQTVYPDGEPAPGVSLEIRYPGNRIETETGSGGIVQLEDIPLETVVEVRVKQQRQGDIEKQFTCTGMGQYPPIVVEDMREKEVILPPPPPPPSPPPPEPGPGIEKETKKRGLWWLWLLLLILILAALIALLRNCHCGKETVPPIVGTPSVPLKNIAITVSDAETGNPIEGAGITVGHEGKRSDGKTDTLGVVEFRDMPEGTALTVFVAAPGYEEKSETLTCCTSHKIRLKPLPSLTPISPSKSIVFTILDANTVQPIESAKVTISFNNQKIDKYR
ncbi:MAG: hypothetical protein QG657_3938, partial [Acidobacteriota bacterium]|nr:hypothetical protein [Acidobacteriota bacterium]